MNSTDIQLIMDGLTSLREKLLAGKAALTGDEINELCNQFQSELQNISESSSLLRRNEIVEIWINILKDTASGDFAEVIMSSLDKESFFNFGSLLLKAIDANPENEKLKSFAHEYLNLFRTSSFLEKIYEEKKWETLVLNLIDISNYNVSVLFKQRVAQYGDKPLFKTIKGSNIEKINWNKTREYVDAYACSFFGLIRNEKAEDIKIAFLLENSPQMPLLDLACLTSGIVNVMIPANSVTEHIKFILNQTESPVLLVHDEKQLAKIKSVKNDLKFLKKVVLLFGTSAEDWVIQFNEFVNYGKDISYDELEKFKNKITPRSLATIMYTSGTTGEPKGIMFSQMNIVYKRFCRAMALPEISDRDRFIAFLPLFHTFGRWLEMMGSIFWGAEYCFMENPAVETMISNMKLVQPTIFISIPKKWMQLYEQITSNVDLEIDEQEKIQNAVKDLTGGKLKWGLSAAGYLPVDVFKFFQEYGVELMSGFGMTEATGGITMTPPRQYRDNSLGKPLPGIDIKLGSDGEILIKGSYVMEGYFGISPDKTFTKDGWLPTGDVMKMDDNGFIEIIDRKKEIYKNIKGETIAPQKIENFFREFETVHQVFLVGDHKAFNTVLIHPDYTIENSPLTNMNEKQKQEYFSSLIVTVNKFLAPFERILDFRIMDRAFSEEKGELTPKGTYKRRVIENNFDTVIETMYRKNYTSVFVGNIEVRIPNWFLREKGSLSRDLIAGEHGIEIPKINASLRLEMLDSESDIFRIGTYNYQVNSDYIDLQVFLINPFYWIGNQELFDFCGESIFQWYRQKSEQPDVKFQSSNFGIRLNERDNTSFNKIVKNHEYSLNGLHLSALALQTNDMDAHNKAIKYLQEILSDDSNYHFNIALSIAIRPVLTSQLETRRKMFKAAHLKLDKSRLEEIFLIFLNTNDKLINNDVIEFLVETKSGEDILRVAQGILQLEFENIENGKQYDNSPAGSILKLLEAHSHHHPTMFKRIRRFMMRYAVFSSSEKFKREADSTLLKLRKSLRYWLGPNQKVGVDMETGEEYSWEDVLTFEEGIDPENRLRIKNALVKTPVLREAVFLFSKGVLLRLENILPGGVWISHLETKSYKSIYRITIQTRFQGGFDITIHLAHNLPPAQIHEEIRWLILPATTITGERLLPRFGGYWEEYELWTEEFVPRESVARFIQKKLKNGDEASLLRLRYLWTYYVWNAAAAYMNFWKLTNYKIMLGNPLPENISIPSHDYQTGTLLYSVSKRTKSNSVVDFLRNFYTMFIEQTISKYSFLDKKSIWNYIFSGIVEVEGETEGLNLLKKFGEELKLSKDFPDKETAEHRLNLFIEKTEAEEFIPKALFFAIKRFHRWFQLNNDADYTAQAEMLFELYETYRLFELEEIHYSTRTIFFLETAFIDSDKSFKGALKQIARRQHTGIISKEDALKLISGLQSQFKLSEKENFFITRLNYPYLKPTDTAMLLTTSGAEEISSNLVVRLSDENNNPFLIRMPTSPKEISRLHQLFFESNLAVHFRPEHQFLVALSERGFIIGGLFYNRLDDKAVHMEKIVVSDRYRRKGISEGLMNELFNRMKSNHIKYVTTGFFRPEYFYKFGFKIERKYSGLVKEL